MKQRSGKLQTSLSLLLICVLVSACSPLQDPPPVPSVTPLQPLSLETAEPTQTPLASPSPFPTASPTASPPQASLQERILPSPYLSPNLVHAPIAWTRSQGEGVIVAVLQDSAEDLELVRLVAPQAEVLALQAASDGFVNGVPLAQAASQAGIQVLVILEPDDFEVEVLVQTTLELIAADVVVLVNGDLDEGPFRVSLINDLEKVGAITVGRITAGGKVICPDINEREINLFAPYGLVHERIAAMTAAGVGALVRAAYPNLNPGDVKQRLIETADKLYLGSDPRTGQWQFNRYSVDKLTGEYSATPASYHLRRVNAARALDAALPELWPLNAMNVPLAWQQSTGKGVTVAVIDQGFHPGNPAFEGKLADKAAFFPGQDFTGDNNFHGTSMAKNVLAVAPDVSLVLLHAGESNIFPLMTKAFAEAIDYAVASEVDVITSSAGPWPNIPEVHAAIERAIDAGIVFVWFHYTGSNQAVIRPGFFWQSAWEVGAFDRFLEADKPLDLEAGLSNTAPQIAGIAALILQNEPALSPAQVKQRILETSVTLPGGASIADAAAAVDNRPSGRTAHLPEISNQPWERVRLTLQNGDEPVETVEIIEQGMTWSHPLMPLKDIFFAQSGARSSLNIYRSGQLYAEIILLRELEGSGDYPARVTIFPQDWFSRYSATVGAGNEPPLQIEITDEKIRIFWMSETALILAGQNPIPAGSSSSQNYRLYQVEVETQILSVSAMPDY
jgi:hypothetical protein